MGARDPYVWGSCAARPYTLILECCSIPAGNKVRAHRTRMLNVRNLSYRPSLILLGAVASSVENCLDLSTTLTCVRFCVGSVKDTIRLLHCTASRLTGGFFILYYPTPFKIDSVCAWHIIATYRSPRPIQPLSRW
jgi:hypothetical protein